MFLTQIRGNSILIAYLKNRQENTPPLDSNVTGDTKTIFTFAFIGITYISRAVVCKCQTAKNIKHNVILSILSKIVVIIIIY